MSGNWHTHDAGLIQLELPPDWVARQPSPGTLLLEDAHGTLGMSIVAVARDPKNSLRPTDADALRELQRWLDSQTHVHMEKVPQAILHARHATAAAEGTQGPRPGGKWYKRLFRRREKLLWRFWAMLNPQLLVLASTHGNPRVINAHRDLLNRLIASMHLPGEDILTGRRFTDTVVSLARTWFPETSVIVIDDQHVQFGARQISLDSLHRRYLASPRQLPTQVRTFLAEAQRGLGGLGGLASPPTRDAWAEVKTHVLPIFIRRDVLNNEMGRVLHEDWINGLSIGYTLEPPGAGDNAPSRLITRDDLRHWSLMEEELQAQAQQNLIARSHEQVMEGRREDGCTILTLARPDRHNAARILLPELHRKLREHLGMTFYAAMPTPNILLAFSTDNAKLLARLREQVIREFHGDPRGLSDKLFLVTPDGIAGDPDSEPEA